LQAILFLVNRLSCGDFVVKLEEISRTGMNIKQGLIFKLIWIIGMLAPVSGCQSPMSIFSVCQDGNTLLDSARSMKNTVTEIPEVPRELDKGLTSSLTAEPGDVLLVQPADLDSPIRLPGDQPVLQDGTISLGKYGRLPVAGRTLDEIESIGTRGGQMSGVPTGFIDLDELTQGLHGGQMIVLAARPAIGKSTLGLDLARSASIKHGLTSVIFSLEMSRNEITMRMLSAEARVPLHHMRAGTMGEEEWGRLARRMGEISAAPLFIDDSPNMNMMEIRAKCRRLKQRNELRLIVIDYLQLMSSGKKVESRQQEVSEFSRQLKLLAKELDVPVVAISQLNRGPEQRTDKKPLLSDLRESGSIEQDADMVILLHREDAYDRDHPRQGEADLIVAKHRNGPTKTVTVAFQGHYSRFVDMATPIN
jgi:KaiC/GvpD/RAD55 family RecA-like ATPase